MNWYYVKHGKQQGPVQVEELQKLAQSGEVGPNDLVWNKTMGNAWAHFSEVPDLNAAPAAAPPPAEQPHGGKLKFANNPSPNVVPSQDAARSDVVRAVVQPKPVVVQNPKGWWGYRCPNCGERVHREHSESAQKWAGLVGIMVSMAFGPFSCPNCGELARSDFPVKTRLRMAFGSLTLIVSAIALFVLFMLLYKATKK
jgi:predicted RNA-binding Zn-ribbon protein involved in translation (DUF1610 family)